MDNQMIIENFIYKHYERVPSNLTLKQIKRLPCIRVISTHLKHETGIQVSNHVLSRILSNKMDLYHQKKPGYNCEVYHIKRRDVVLEEDDKIKITITKTELREILNEIEDLQDINSTEFECLWLSYKKFLEDHIPSDNYLTEIGVNLIKTIREAN